MQVVDQSTSDLFHKLETTILILIVQRGSPVVGVVTMYSARGTGGCLSVCIVHLEIEAVTAHDSMDMTGYVARTDDGVGTLDNERRSTW